MNTREFLATTAPEILYLALEPITPPPGTAACATHDPNQFDSPQRQQLAFDGEALTPEADYPAARAMCTRCPLLDACRRYADHSGETHTFLAGMTVAERSTRRTKKIETAHRHRKVENLRGLGAPTSLVAELVGRDPSLIRRDLRALQQQGRRAL